MWRYQHGTITAREHRNTFNTVWHWCVPVKSHTAVFHICFKASDHPSTLSYSACVCVCIWPTEHRNVHIHGNPRWLKCHTEHSTYTYKGEQRVWRIFTREFKGVNLSHCTSVAAPGGGAVLISVQPRQHSLLALGDQGGGESWKNVSNLHSICFQGKGFWLVLRVMEPEVTTVRP